MHLRVVRHQQQKPACCRSQGRGVDERVHVQGADDRAAKAVRRRPGQHGIDQAGRRRIRAAAPFDVVHQPPEEDVPALPLPLAPGEQSCEREHQSRRVVEKV